MSITSAVRNHKKLVHDNSINIVAIPTLNKLNSCELYVEFNM